MTLKEVIQYLKELEIKYGNLSVFSEYDGQYDRVNKANNFIYEEIASDIAEKIIRL